MRTSLTLIVSLAALAGCQSAGGFVAEAPEEVAALAAPNQNLSAVTVLEADNCYWYRHVGPVETTLLPLLSKRGAHICVQQPG